MHMRITGAMCLILTLLFGLSLSVSVTATGASVEFFFGYWPYGGACIAVFFGEMALKLLMVHVSDVHVHRKQIKAISAKYATGADPVFFFKLFTCIAMKHNQAIYVNKETFKWHVPLPVLDSRATIYKTK